MKILVLQGSGANYWIRLSLCNAWRATGHEVFYWDKSGKSAFDVFEEFRPDVFLGDVWQLDRATIKNLSKYNNIKTILYSDIWGNIEKEIDFNKYPVGRTTDEQKALVESLIKSGANFHNVISNHGPKDVLYTHNEWNNTLGLSIHSVLVSADITQYFPADTDDYYNIQLAYVGGYWPYKSGVIDQYLIPLLYPNTKNWRIRIFGSGWSTVQSLGQISVDEVRKHYTNCQTVVHCVEPHCAFVYQDLPLRYFEVPACQGFGISCPCIGIRDIFDEDELVVAESPSDFIEKVVFFLNNPEASESYRWKAYKKVLTEHTGFHRCRQIFSILQEPTDILDETIDRIKEGINK